MPRMTASLLAFALAFTTASIARADLFWVAYEADNLPEQSGWTRVFESPGGIRSASAGIFVLNTISRPAVYDFNFRQATAILDPGEELAFEWRVRVTGSIHDTFIQVGRGAVYGGIGPSIGPDTVQISDTVSLPIASGVFHSYRLVTSDMRNFRLWIDGSLAWTYAPVTLYQPNINVLFGDWTGFATSISSVSEWDYFRFGVVPIPAPTSIGMLVVAGSSAAMTSRRRRRREP